MISNEVKTEPRMLRIGDLLGELELDATARHTARTTGTALGPVTGLAALDLLLGGCLPPGAHIVHGGPGIGKTALALQIAATCGCPALYVTCEMAPVELLRRLTARATRTYLGKLKSGELPPAMVVELARRAAASAPDLRLADGTQVWASPAWLAEALEVARGQHPHVLLVVDSAHAWAAGLPGALSEYDGLNLALAALQEIAGRLGCPVLTIAERNRASARQGGLYASAGSRKFEYGAESMLSLERAEEGRDDPAGGPVEVILRVEKNRHGVGGKVELEWHGALQTFREGGF